MDVAITDVYEGERGCGRRKPGGKYLVSGGAMVPCGRMPIPLDRCPTCSCGIKAARGWTWLELSSFLKAAPTADGSSGCPGARSCGWCPLGPNGPARVGLLWVGSVFYAKPEAFMREAAQMGISRRIAQVPKGFEVGKTWVLLAHRKPEPHAFTMFRPERVEYVVRAEDSNERLAALAKQGLTLVRVHAQQADLGLPPARTLPVVN
jgi:hypothetical protein